MIGENEKKKKMHYVPSSLTILFYTAPAAL